MRAATSMFLTSLANALLRLASMTAFLCFVVAHLECPDISLLPSRPPDPGGMRAHSRASAERDPHRGSAADDGGGERADQPAIGGDAFEGLALALTGPGGRLPVQHAVALHAQLDRGADEVPHRHPGDGSVLTCPLLGLPPPAHGDQ